MSLHGDDKINGIDRFEVEDVMRSMQRVEKARKDSKMMKAVDMLADEKIDAITSIKQLRDVRDKKIKENTAHNSAHNSVHRNNKDK